MYKVGIGYDVHQLKSGESLILGGVDIEFDKGISGHSDGDVLTHSIIDSILGASSNGDIGKHFPSSDEKWKNFSSLKMLGFIYNDLIKKDYRIEHIDAVLILQEPNLSRFIEEMKSNILENLNNEKCTVSIKATTTDYLGFIGEGKGIACQVIATLIKK
ncbi:MAG: 2-C-methyl-D-erythritol 2,4-cyclodiphosphate synthase [Candidatus Marinimicrobia bacterium]|nr:2-C-methyl-D-erythritol 2,4-cyclodiphosphate synthase [Candidatus Neomarinimicrobiota bacterium]